MANNVVGSLLVNLGLETGRLSSDTEKAAKHFNSFDKKASRALNNVRRQASGLGSALTSLTGIAGTLSIAGLGALAKSSIDSADKIGKLSTRIGASTEALSQYQHVAELSGVRFETLTMGWQRMTRRVAEAAQGTGEARGALQELNLSAQDLAQLKPEQQFEVIADALNGVSNEGDKVRLAMKLFDSEGVSLLQTMEGGAAGIRAMRKEADDLGLTLDKKATRGAAEANDALTRMAASGKALGLTMAKALGPAITDVANWLSVNLPGAVEFASTAFGAFRHFVLEGVQFVTTGLIKFYDLLGRLPGSLGETYRDASKDLQFFNSSIEQTQMELALAAGKAQEFKSSADFSGGGGGYGGGVGAGDGDGNTDKGQRAIAALEMQLMTEEERIAESYFRREELLNESWERGLISDQEWQDLSTQSWHKYQGDLTSITDKEAKRRQQIESSVQGKIDGLKARSMNLAINFLSTLGQKHKGFAYAALALEKFLAIQQINIEANKAHMAAYGLLALGVAGPAAVSAMHTQIEASRAMSIGLTAAAGIAQAANINSGVGGSSGDGVTPVSSVDNPLQDSPVNSGGTSFVQSNEIRIRIVGSGDEFTEMVAKSIEQAEANDRITIIRA